MHQFQVSSIVKTLPVAAARILVLGIAVSWFSVGNAEQFSDKLPQQDVSTVPSYTFDEYKAELEKAREHFTPEAWAKLEIALKNSSGLAAERYAGR